MLLHELVSQSSPDFFQPRCCYTKLERIWGSEVKVRQDLRIELLDCKANVYLMSWTFVNVVNDIIFSFLSWFKLFKADTIWKIYLNVTLFANFTLTLVDLLEDLTLRHCQYDFMSETH